MPLSNGGAADRQASRTFSVRDVSFQCPVASFNSQSGEETEHPLTGSWQLATGNWQLATGDWRLAAIRT
jgi:hypothetical protein